MAMEKRTLQVNMRFSPSERQALYRNAGAAGMNPQQYIRHLATQPYQPPTDQQSH